MHACENGHKEIVILLLEKGADINAQNIVSEFPIHVLCNMLQLFILTHIAFNVLYNSNHDFIIIIWCRVFSFNFYLFSMS